MYEFEIINLNFDNYKYLSGMLRHFLHTQ